MTRTDGNGTYVFCGVPSLEGLNVTGELMGTSSRAVSVSQDTEAPTPPIYVRWSKPVDITGRVVDGATGTPLDGVRIDLPGRPARSLTNEDGEFRIAGQGAGPLVLRSTRVGYMPRTDTVEVSSGDRLDFEIPLYEEAVELDPIVVRVRSDSETERRAVASRIDAMSITQIDSILPRVTDIVDLIRAGNFPGVRIERGVGGVCIEMTRGGSTCNGVTVFLNGTRLDNPSLILTILPESIGRIQFFDPMEAAVRYGGPRVQNGVLVITLR
jgi:hypothetical protein